MGFVVLILYVHWPAVDDPVHTPHMRSRGRVRTIDVYSTYNKLYLNLWIPLASRSDFLYWLEVFLTLVIFFSKS